MGLRRIAPYRRGDGTAVAGHFRQIRERLDGRTGDALRAAGGHNPLLQLGSPSDEDKAANPLESRGVKRGVYGRGMQMGGATVAAFTILDSDFTGADFSNATFPEFGKVSRSTFDGANLTIATLSMMKMKKNSFRGTNLRGASCQYTTFRGSDFTDADFTGSRLEGADLRGCTWTRTNMKNVKLNNANSEITPDSNLFRVARYERFTFDDVAARTGTDHDTLRVLLWANDIEVRDNKTAELVTGDFDPEQHHIPIWAVEKLLAA